jgi:hypothetical protein
MATAMKRKAGKGTSRKAGKTAVATKAAPVKPAKSNPEYVSINQFARKFGKSRSAIHKACKAGRIKSIPFPTVGEKEQRLIPYSEVERIEQGLGDQLPQEDDAAEK